MVHPELSSRQKGWIARYWGGEYIEIYAESRPHEALTVINVYDYAKGEPTIPFTQAAVRYELSQWLERDEEGWREADDLVEHVLPYM